MLGELINKRVQRPVLTKRLFIYCKTCMKTFPEMYYQHASVDACLSSLDQKLESQRHLNKQLCLNFFLYIYFKAKNTSDKIMDLFECCGLLSPLFPGSN